MTRMGLLSILGNLYVADKVDHRVRKVAPNGIITTFAGTGTPGFGGDGGPAVNALLITPERVSLDAAANLYFADIGGYRIRKVSPSGIITTVAGSGQPGYCGNGRGHERSIGLSVGLLIAIKKR